MLSFRFGFCFVWVLDLPLDAFLLGFELTQLLDGKIGALVQITQLVSVLAELDDVSTSLAVQNTVTDYVVVDYHEQVEDHESSEKAYDNIT